MRWRVGPIGSPNDARGVGLIKTPGQGANSRIAKIIVPAIAEAIGPRNLDPRLSFFQQPVKDAFSRVWVVLRWNQAKMVDGDWHRQSVKNRFERSNGVGRGKKLNMPIVACAHAGGDLELFGDFSSGAQAIGGIVDPQSPHAKPVHLVKDPGICIFRNDGDAAGARS